MTIRIHAKSINITVVGVYPPKTDATLQEIENFYATIEDTLKTILGKDSIYLFGDFNKKNMDFQREARITGSFGIGERNDARDRLA